jgi:hypothetical protein
MERNEKIKMIIDVASKIFAARQIDDNFFAAIKYAVSEKENVMTEIMFCVDIADELVKLVDENVYD